MTRASAYLSPCRAVIVACAAVLGGGPCAAQPALPVLPSGADYSLLEVLYDAQPGAPLRYARFRFVMPDIGGALDYAEVAEDFQQLCDLYAAPQVAVWIEPVDQIVISFADRAIEFGTIDAETTQFFEAFRLEDAACIWEEF